MFGEGSDNRGLIPRAAEHIFHCLAAKGSTTDIAIGCSFLEIYNDAIRDLAKVYVVSSKNDESATNIHLFEKTSDIFNSIAKKRVDPYLSRAFSKNLTLRSLNEKSPGLKEVQDEYDTMNYEIREDNEGNVFVKDLMVVHVSSVEEIMAIINMGLKLRATHETKMNAMSSRSHTVFTIQIIQKDRNTEEATMGMLNLVDLAGSERLKRSESQGQRLKEAVHINSSLTTLGKVVMALDPSADMSHVPYRESKLTRLLQNSLGGNSYTVLLANIHPDPTYYDECLSTLQFANRCRNVRNNPRVNYVSAGEGIEESGRKIKRMTEEISSLRMRLAQLEGGSDRLGVSPFDGLDRSKRNLVFLHQVTGVLRKLGIDSSVSAEGSLVLGDGRHISGDTIQEVIASGAGIAASILGIDVGAAIFPAGLGGSGASSAELEVLRERNKELAAELHETKERLKEKKQRLEELERNNKVCEAEINRLRGNLVHSQFESTKALEAAQGQYTNNEELLIEKHTLEMNRLVEQNQKLLKQSNAVLRSLPKTLRMHTEQAKRAQDFKFEYDDAMKVAFQKHLAELDENRIAELDMLKQQYEFWLKQKDDILIDFVAKFNAYRERKTRNLHLCEKEMAEMLDHIKRNENILKNVENGRYFMQHKQSTAVASTAAAESDTGVMSVLFPRGQVLSRGNSRPGSARPSQPAAAKTAAAEELNQGSAIATMKMPAFRPPAELYPIAAKIAMKYENRRKRELQQKDQALDAVLNNMNATGTQRKSGTPAMEPELEEYIRGLLMSPNKSDLRIRSNDLSGLLKSGYSNQTSREPAAASGSARRPQSASAARQTRPAMPEEDVVMNRISVNAADIRGSDDLGILEDKQSGDEVDVEMLRAEIFMLRKEINRLSENKSVEKVTDCWRCSFQI
jgi:hypothetical protein